MLLKKKLRKLYNSGLSMKAISEKQELSYPTVKYWMEKYNIPRRSWSEATYVKRNLGGDPFKIKNKLTPKEKELFGLGMGIYWGEGDKSLNNTAVRVSNTDPFLIKKFREFLRKIYKVREEKIKYGLILFNDSNKNRAVDFWKKHLNIKRKQLGKITVISHRGKGSYKKKSEYGVLIIIFVNKKLKEKILSDIARYNY